MNYSISNTAEYGDLYQSGPRIINKEETKKRMKFSISRYPILNLESNGWMNVKMVKKIS